MDAMSAINYFETLARLLREITATDESGASLDVNDALGSAAAIVNEVKVAGNTVMLVGNGGSAAVVSHMQNDLCKAGGLRAIVFTEQPLLTAYSNDDGYDTAFASATKLWASDGGALIAISSSGKSANILNACTAAKKAGSKVITLSGFAIDNPLHDMGNVNIHVASRSYGQVETAHAAIGHYLTDLVCGLIQEN